MPGQNAAAFPKRIAVTLAQTLLRLSESKNTITTRVKILWTTGRA